MWLEILIFLSLVYIIDMLARIYATRNLINIPLISKIPIFGSLWALSTLTPDNFSIRWPQFIARYGKTFCGRCLGLQIVVTVDHRIVEAVLSSQEHLKKHYLYQMLSNWLGQGLLLSDGKTWRTIRKIITPTFHFKILEQFLEVFEFQTNIFLEKLKPLADGRTVVNIYEYMSLLTMDIITETAMGVKINAQLNAKSEYVKAVKEVTDIMALRFVRPHLIFRFTLSILAPQIYNTLQKDIKTMHEFTEKIIAERQSVLQHCKDRETGIDFKKDSHEWGIKRRMALLDVLLQSTIEGEPMTDKQIRDEVSTFMFAGHDTTTSATSFCLYALSRHAEVQQKLYQELKDYFGDQLNSGITFNDLQQLNYLNCVIKESLRLYPPIVAIGRVLRSNLIVDKYTLPAKANVIILLWEMLRDPTVFEQPLRFIPERHLMNNARVNAFSNIPFSAGPHKYTLPAKANVIILLWEMLRDPTVFEQPLRFIPERHLMNNARVNAFSNIPFSAGPRNCIGQKFAQLEMRVMIIKVLWNFELLPLGEDIQPIMQLILRSKTGINLGLRKRVT